MPGDRQARRRAVADAPGVEAGRHVQAGRPVRGRLADVGHAIRGVVILVAPAPGDLADRQVAPGPLLQIDEAPGDVAILPGIEARPQDEQQRTGGVAAGTQGMGRHVGADEHAVDRRRIAGPERHRHVAARLRAVGVAERRVHRHVGGDHHCLGIDLPRLGADAPAPVLLEAHGPAVLVNPPAARLHGGRQAEQIAGRVELRLVGELQRRPGGKGQGRALEHPRLKAQAAGRLGLGLDGLLAAGGAGIDIGRLALVVAGDAQGLDALADARDRRAVGLGVGPRQLETGMLDQLPVDQRVLGGDLRRRAAGHLAADLARLEHDDRLARLAQLQRRGQADDAGADDHHVAAGRTAQGRAVRLGGIRRPAAIGCSSHLSHRDLHICVCRQDRGPASRKVESCRTARVQRSFRPATPKAPSASALAGPASPRISGTLSNSTRHSLLESLSAVHAHPWFAPGFPEDVALADALPIHPAPRPSERMPRIKP